MCAQDDQPCAVDSDCLLLLYIQLLKLKLMISTIIMFVDNRTINDNNPTIPAATSIKLYTTNCNSQSWVNKLSFLIENPYIRCATVEAGTKVTCLACICFLPSLPVNMLYTSKKAIYSSRNMIYQTIFISNCDAKRKRYTLQIYIQHIDQIMFML